MKNLKEASLLVLFVLFTFSLPLIGKWSSDFLLLESFSKSINKQIVYQLTTLAITAFLLVLLWQFRKQVFLEYFRKGNISAPIIPVPFVGIKAKPKENWLHLGRNFSIVISAVTATVIYFQIVAKHEISFIRVVKVLPFSLVFALINSFVEESITRIGVVVLLKNKIADKHIALVSGVLFGTVHYWGNPGGIVGVLVAGFLAWFLAKSILETKGIFWAWLIHFFQDIIIFSALLSV